MESRNVRGFCDGWMESICRLKYFVCLNFALCIILAFSGIFL